MTRQTLVAAREDVRAAPGPGGGPADPDVPGPPDRGPVGQLRTDVHDPGGRQVTEAELAARCSTLLRSFA